MVLSPPTWGLKDAPAPGAVRRGRLISGRLCPNTVPPESQNVRLLPSIVTVAAEPFVCVMRTRTALPWHCRCSRLVETLRIRMARRRASPPSGAD